MLTKKPHTQTKKKKKKKERLWGKYKTIALGCGVEEMKSLLLQEHWGWGSGVGACSVLAAAKAAELLSGDESG